MTPLPAFLRVEEKGVVLAVKVQPRASRNEIGPAMGEVLKVKVTAPPVDSAANEALVRLVAERLGCGRQSVELIRGRTSRTKQLAVYGLAPEEILRRLGGLGF